MYSTEGVPVTVLGSLSKRFSEQLTSYHPKRLEVKVVKWKGGRRASDPGELDSVGTSILWSMVGPLKGDGRR